MRALILDPPARRRIADLVAMAKLPDHWYVPGKTTSPGDQADHVVNIDQGFRCVFSWTREGKIYRHLSISVRALGDVPDRWPAAADVEDRLPNPHAVYLLAAEFGFTGAKLVGEVPIGPGPDWNIGRHPNEPCVVVVQEVA